MAPGVDLHQWICILRETAAISTKAVGEIMGWLIRRVVVMWVILIVICAGVVGIVRANGGQDRLQAMGFGVCEGEPCWRGIRVGIAWSETRRLRLYAGGIEPPIVFNFNGVDQTLALYIFRSADSKTVSAIELNSVIRNTRPSVADLVRRFGEPCWAFFTENNIQRIGTAYLYYPGMVSSVPLIDYRISMDTQIQTLTIGPLSKFGPCLVASSATSGPWRGFASAESYFVRNRRTLGLSQ